ncbi:MAG TPA: DUF1501 domain-containing protein [Gemmataceae bacterium]|nr:DUF1501 domain-containing protein [Gemmataceae bacterium]
MLTLFGPRLSGRTCAGVSRRDFLRIGALGFGGLTLADLLRSRAQGAVRSEAAHKSVIMIYLPGGPSHIDMYDLKPDAPAEYRGEFKPIRTNVPGIDLCELMPRQATIADKFSILRGLQTRGNHDPTELLTGIPAAASGFIGPVRRPAFGCVVSKLRGGGGAMPPYVSVSDHRLLSAYDDPEDPAYLGPAHRPFSAVGPIMKNLTRPPEITLERLEERVALLRTFDALQKEMDNAQRSLEGMDSYQKRALEMIVSTRVRDALDLSREPDRLREQYGVAGTDLLRARRLVEAGVSVVSVAARFPVRLGGGINDPGGWDTHGHNFKLLRAKLPIYDQAVFALLSDLHARGLDRDVAVVIWGEFGRTPRIGDVTPDGRGHWPAAGCALMAGGGLRMGQIVGATDGRAENPRGRPFTPQDVLATLYYVLGIDRATTLPDFTGRPQHLLDRGEKITELI